MPPCSPSAAPATRSTPRSSPAGSPAAAGSWSRPTPAPPTSSSSTPAGSSSRPRRTRSTPCSRRPTRRRPAGRRSSRSAASPSATAPSWPRACPRPTPCSASTPTPSWPSGSATCSAATRLPRTSRSTGARCCRSRPVERPAAAGDVAVPGHAWVPDLARTRLSDAPVAPLKLASGCDRRCAFCAIPSFRGAFVSRPPDDVVAEAAWLGMQGVRELVLVSENSTSYGKDLPGGAGRARAAAAAAGRTCRASTGCGCRYLQPAEMRPDLLEVIATTPGVAPYFDLSFQHASPAVLRRMRRFGSRERLPRPVRADPGARARGRHPQQRHRRLPRRDRGRPRRAGGVPHRGAARRGRRVRLLRRGRHRGGRLRRQAPVRGDRRPGRRGSPRWSTS